MFWKVMAVIWTVMFASLFGATKYWMKTERVTESAGIEESEAPRGTQATALIENVPAKHMFMPEFIVLSDSVLKSAAKEFLSDKTVQDLRNQISIRFIGSSDVGYMAIDVSKCEEKAHAKEIAREVAQAYILHAKKTINSKLLHQIEVLEEEKRSLQKHLQGIRKSAEQELREVRIPFFWEKRNTLKIRLQLLTEKLMELELRKAKADSALARLEEHFQKGRTSQDESLLQQREDEAMAITAQLLELRQSYYLASAQARDVQGNLMKLEQLKHQRMGVNKRIQTIEEKLIDLRILFKGDEGVPALIGVS